MPLTPEDGTIVAGANTFASVAELKAYATDRGLSYPADAVIEAALIEATDYLNTLDFKGERTDPANQEICFPRTGVYLFGQDEEFDPNGIPSILIKGQCQLALDSITLGGTLSPTGDGREVIKEKVDVLEVQYNPRSSGSVLPEYNKAMGILAPLLDNGTGFSLTSCRA